MCETGVGGCKEGRYRVVKGFVAIVGDMERFVCRRGMLCVCE